jgi:muramoyltetrapeptide carboxypeptidase
LRLHSHKDGVAIKPARLYPGDTIGIVAPASAPPDPAAIDKSISTVEELGFKALPGGNARARWGYLAGNDRERAGDLMKMFANRRVKGILCVRGGYGAARLLPRLDYEVIRANPKVFVGYSDITSLHLAFLKEAGLISFHGPMLNSDLIKEDVPEFTVKSLLRAITRPEPMGSISEGYKGKTVKVLRKGKARGVLVGGNLTLFCASIGTPWQVSLSNTIFFLEDLDEEPYRFDRMLTQLLNAGILQRAKGIAVGINKGCEDPKARRSKEYRQSLEDVLREKLLPLGVPVVSGLPFGHVPWNATVPVGVKAVLDADKGDLFIEEGAVAEG